MTAMTSASGSQYLHDSVSLERHWILHAAVAGATRPQNTKQ